MLKFLLVLSILSTVLSAKYTNCYFQNPHFRDICKDATSRGVSVHYANVFLLSYKTKKYDFKSYRYLKPKYRVKHNSAEIKANNTLVKYVPAMVKHLKKYSKVYDEAEKRYSVNREVIAAILMKETRLGKINPPHDAFSVFNTIVYKLKPKTRRDRWLMELGKTNMASLITYCYHRGASPYACKLPSSYAGAVGISQFMPNSFKYIDSYKSKYGDLTKIEDAIMSTASFLHKKAGMNTLVEFDKFNDLPSIESKWYEFDYVTRNSSFAYQRSIRYKKNYNCFACGNKKLAYLSECTKKIMVYNQSSNYAIGVLRLAYDAHYKLKNI